MPSPDDVMANDVMQIVLYDCDCPFGNNYEEKRIHTKSNTSKENASTKTICVVLPQLRALGNTQLKNVELLK